MFDWVTKTAAEMTTVDELMKSFTIIGSILLIYLVGYIAIKVEAWWKNRKLH